MAPPELPTELTELTERTDGPEPESDAGNTPETEDAASATKAEVVTVNDERPHPDRARERKVQRQRRMKQAWKKLVDSFDEVFYNSDASDDSEQSLDYRPRSPRRRFTEDEIYVPAPPRRIYDDVPYRPAPARYIPPPPRPVVNYYDRDISIRSRSRSRSVSDIDGKARSEIIIEAPAAPPISYVTELYDYSDASRRGEYEEAYLKHSFEKNNPVKVFQAKGVDQTAVEGLVFKLVSMYAIPPTSRKRDRRSRNRYDDPRDDDLGSDIVRQAEKSLGILAALGTYMTIHSQAVLRALRTIIPMHPDLPKMAETITLPEPFCFIVQYKKEIEEYVADLPALPEPEPVPVPAPKPVLEPVAEPGTVPAAEPAAVPIAEPAIVPVAEPAVKPAVEKADVEETTAKIDDADVVSIASTAPRLKRAELTEEQQERHDLQVLMNYIFRDEFGKKYDAEMALRAQKKCTFELAWMLFRPGAYVYSWEGDSLNCFIVDSFELEGLFAKRTRSSQAEVRPRNRLRGQEFGVSRIPESIVVKMCYLEFDGEYIGRRPKKVVISAFEGEKNINALPVFPQEYCTFENTRQNLIDRGKKYIELTKRTYAEYDGETLSIPQRSVKSRIMIDSRTYYNDRDSGMTKAPKLKVPKEEGAISSESSLSDASDDSATPYRARRSMRSHKRRIRDLKRRPNRNTILTEHDILDPDDTEFRPEQYMLLTQKVYGFILKERVWDMLDVSSVKEPKFQEEMIDDLVLKDEAKILVQALSNSHAIAAGTDPYTQKRGLDDVGSAPTKWSADFVQNKGEGRIFLLHGKPGVGKTTTAECVAEQSRSPLLSITCGDLGIYPDEVERNLMKWLKLATLWKAVLLLDEADVYLESRISGDLQRNSLVSIFLRALEYYQGLLFLTTNRIGTFDEALISRIHVVLHYPDFTDAQRQTIWHTSFRKLDEERPDIKLGPGVMDYALDHEDLKKLKWNGREIRNAFNTIVALAEFDAEKKRRAKPGQEKSVVVRLERTHLMQVVEMSGKFKEYMRRTKGMDESKFQHVARVRDGDIIEDHRDPRRGYRGDIPMRTT